MSNAQQGERSKRLTIGYLTSWIHDPVFQALWAGIDDVARKHDANLICFPGSTLQFPPRLTHRNVVYDLIAPESCDGLIMGSDSLATYISAKEFEVFCQRYRSLPLASIARALDGVPSVLVDNEQGMRSAVAHLIEVHGLSRIAFVHGPEGHQEAELRYRAYTEALAQHNLPLDPDLTVPGDFTWETGREAIHKLLDRRKLLPGSGFEAVVAANDDMALGALEALQARGIRVPNDVALIGFDNRDETQYTIPPLTTVRNPLYEAGAQAAEMLLAQIEGRDVPKRVVLSSELVARRSCGCLLSTVTCAAAMPVIPLPVEEPPDPLSTQRERILPALVHAVEVPEDMGTRWAEQLLDAFVTEMEGESEGAFLATLEDILYSAAASSPNVSEWQDALSVLRRHALPYLGRDEMPRAEGLLGQARVLVGDMAQRLQGYRTVQIARQSRMLHDSDYAVMDKFDLTALLDAAADEIARAGIPSCYLSLYEDPEAPAEWSRLILAYEREKRIKLEDGGLRFPSRQLVPDGLLPSDRRYSMVLEPLLLRDAQLGFSLLEAEPTQGETCEILRRQISSALHTVLLLREREETGAALERAYAGVEKQIETRTIELQQEIAERRRVEEALKHRLEQLAALSQASQAVTASLEPNQVLAEIVSLANGVVGSDYTSVILMDEAGNIGQSAENLPGVQALEYRIRDEGFTHWIVRLRRAVVVDEIKEDGTVRPGLGEGAPSRANPLLVEAGIKSFAGLPLMVKDRLLGVLYLHSLRFNAFGGQLFLLSAFANQVAIAIENARLFQAEQQQTQRLALLVDVTRTAATTFDADALLQAVAESIFRRFAYPQVGIFTLDEEGRTLTLRGRSTANITVEELAIPGFYHLPIEQGVCGYVARTGKPYLVPDVSTDPHFVNPTKAPLQSALCVPILDGNNVVGTIIVESEQLAHFGERDQSLLEAVADTVAIGLRNTRLYQEAQRRVQELTLLNTISIGPGTILKLDAMINDTLEGLHELIDADRIIFITTDTDVGSWEITHAWAAPGVEPTIGVSGTLDSIRVELKALLDGQPFAISDVATDPRIEAAREVYQSLEVESALGMPVKIGKRLCGMLGLVYCHERHVWHPDEIRLLEAVAQQLSLVLENAHLFVETRLHAEELAATLARLEELDRLKDKFIQNVSHELRSPLALIRGYAEMLDSGELGEIPPEQRQPVAVITRRSRMLSDLVQDITLILEAEVSPPEPEPVLLDELARNAVEDFQMTIEQAGLTLRAEIAPDIPPVNGTPTYLRRVLDNLLGNAVKFTPGGGTITVQVRQQGEYVALEVSDTGLGIPPDEMSRIFDRFYQVDGSASRRYGGMGLGLALVKDLVETYGGRVTVESQVDEGSTFTALLPISAGANATHE